MPEGISLIQADKTLTKQPYDSEALLQGLLADYPDLRQRLTQVEGYDIPDAINRRPRLDLALLADERRLKALLAALDWELAEIRK